MKIGFWGEGPWAHDSLERLLRSDLFEVLFVVGRAKVYDRTLESIAKGSGIPFFRPEKANGEEFLDIVAEFTPDINVSMSYDQILRSQLINSAPLGFINCHAGALPFYRGRNILNWVLINGENKFGITVHYIDEGIDTGDIIKQEFVDILPEDDYGSILQKAERYCPCVLESALCDIVAGTAKRISQNSIHPVGFYCGRRIDGDESIDWNWSSERIHNFVRGIALPAPCARTWYKKKEIAILSSSLIDNAPTYIGTPGEIIGVTTEGSIVKTGDTFLLLTKIREVESLFPNQASISFGTCALRRGERLG